MTDNLLENPLEGGAVRATFPLTVEQEQEFERLLNVYWEIVDEIPYSEIVATENLEALRRIEVAFQNLQNFLNTTRPTGSEGIQM